MVVEIVVYLDVEVAEFDVVGESVAYQKRLAAEELLAIGGRRNLVVGDDGFLHVLFVVFVGAAESEEGDAHRKQLAS